ncbi:MAG: hypothetical protein LBH75_02345 [Treponema sp.]|nr:hypothetical protein [Treponema sp.]
MNKICEKPRASVDTETARLFPLKDWKIESARWFAGLSVSVICMRNGKRLFFLSLRACPLGV